MQTIKKDLKEKPSYLLEVINQKDNLAYLEQIRAKEYSEHIQPLTGERHVFIPWSGGLDSTTSLLMAIESGVNISTVNFNYGQPYFDKELSIIKNLREKIHKLYPNSVDIWKEHFEVNISWMDEQLKSVLKGDWRHLFPMRNYLILRETLEVISKKEFNEVWFSCVQGEIPFSGGDKSLVFLIYMQQVFSQKRTALFAPFIGMTKTDIVNWAIADNERYEIIKDTISCFSGQGINHCGECQSCFNRVVAFFNANKTEDAGFILNRIKLQPFIDYYETQLKGKNSYSISRKMNLQKFIDYLNRH